MWEGQEPPSRESSPLSHQRFSQPLLEKTIDCATDDQSSSPLGLLCLQAMLRTLSSLLLLSSTSLASPLLPRQTTDILQSLTSEDHHLPYVGAPLGNFYKSTKTVTCDPIRLSFGGGAGGAYFLSIVNGSSSALPPKENVTAVQDPESAQTLIRLGVMGIPGMTWIDIDREDLELGSEVALQVVDGSGNVGYSLSRKVVNGHPNEFCYYPGRFWPPDKWDGTHFSAILLFFFLVLPFGLGYLGGYKSLIKEKASSIISHLDPRRSRNRGDGDEADGALQLEERLERGEREGEETHVLGDEEERTSEDEDSRPLLNGEENERRNTTPRRQGTTTSLPDTAPPGYEEAIKEEEETPSTTLQTQNRI